MALQRTLDMLQAGERINDRLYVATVEGASRPVSGQRTYRPMSGRIRSLLRAANRDVAAWPIMIPRGAHPPGSGW